ncbi:MAG TPA: TIGR04086 family membrane protein, partial [Terriglobales bacterium]|nr:TIGR04086 family membrane protein [Terriglobales bacterium]
MEKKSGYGIVAAKGLLIFLLLMAVLSAVGIKLGSEMAEKIALIAILSAVAGYCGFGAAKKGEKNEALLGVAAGAVIFALMILFSVILFGTFPKGGAMLRLVATTLLPAAVGGGIGGRA